MAKVALKSPNYRTKWQMSEIRVDTSNSAEIQDRKGDENVAAAVKEIK